VEDLSYGGATGRVWYQNNWEPRIPCVEEMRMGLHGDGGKWVCDPLCLLVRNNCLVYSFGSNNQFDFEEAIVKAFECKAHTFDHTIGTPVAPPGITFHPFGLAGSKESTSAALKSIDEMIEENGHFNTTIDILKMDIEGAEFLFLSNPRNVEWMKRSVRQFLVEFHFQGPESQEKVARSLTDAGFRVFHKEPNTLGCGGDCIEYALLNINLVV
jgi:hypothetical protein